jgi:uncharacterized protein YjbI with pentapeptide repeats
MEQIRIHKEKKQIEASDFDLEGSNFKKGSLNKSRFENIMMQDTTIFDVTASNMKIVNANLSDLEIEGAQLGGALIHNIGKPPKGHPAYVEGAGMRPVRFDDCDLRETSITNCNLNGGEISDCNLGGMVISDCNLSGAALKDCNFSNMTINGIPVQDLLTAYKAAGSAQNSRD